MPTFEYIDKNNKVASIESNSAEEAMRNAPNIASNSGVILKTNQTSSLSTTRGKKALDNAKNKLSDIKGSNVTTDPISGRPNMGSDATGATGTGSDTTADYVELYNPTNERTMKISNVKSNLNQIKTLMEQGFEITESNTSANIPYSSGMSVPGEDQYEKILRAEQRKLEQFKTSSAELASEIRGIEREYDSRIETIKEINNRREQSFQTLGYRIGGRFSGGVQGGVFGSILSEEERQGQKRVSDLEDAKKAEIKAAEQAAKTNNWKIYLEAVKRTEEIYNKQLKAVEEYNKAVKTQNDKLQEKLAESTQEAALVDLYKQGVTDPLDLYDYMNFDDNGNQIGDVSLDTITNLLKDINQGAGGYTQTQRLKLEQAGLLDADRQSQLNYLYGKKGKSGGTSEMTFEKFLKTPIAQQTISRAQTDPNVDQNELESILRNTYEQNRDNPFAGTKSSSYTATSIPSDIKTDLIDDITRGASLSDIYAAYPEVSSSYVSSLYNSLKKKKSTSVGGMTDEQFMAELNKK